MKKLATYAAVWAALLLYAGAVIRAEQPKPEQPCVSTVTGDYKTKRAALMRQLVLIQEQIIELDRSQVGMQHVGNEYKGDK